MSEYSITSFFSGAGLGDKGIVDAGVRINQSFEMDANAVKTYNANFDHQISETDITKTLVLEQTKSEGMVFSYPCTRYSNMANLHGTQTGDDLYLHALRFLAIARPEFYAVENVVGLKYFKIVMEAMTKMSDYYVQIFCPVESSIFVPQRRDRLVILATKKYFNFRPPENLKPVSLASILEKNPQISIPKSVYTRLDGGYRDLPIISDPRKGDIAPCCLAHYGKDRGTRLVVDTNFPRNVRPYTVREYARLQGLEDSFVFPVCDTEAFKQIGNGITRHVGIWIGTEFKRYMSQGRRIASNLS
ncbi:MULTISPECIES: DNA cytosine methyltransferase [Vibrio]|uniref:DNA (cytosine-5-)-methyltransferase n=1 Tax=Vibrio tasmaniensis TaxID=212663 RepID=A0A2N7NCQ6_9VIBR|nr:DNA cytosine methyltransferase [Vibrio tasmaniensis]PMO89841.1 DNA (cytosine-5-)-methyltransferase [Vibrio tasmaniensis]PMP09986.1 DNA (cytosine-5-)-methyltransferase [Vibrio tasmaniensis]TKG32630.1 DNA (cytosine-5-)-methyltransferase [Vibrio tasmaniensis]TKG41686.1 DNA (cytosine-5-)-methyltransferase [Vibrio tasmaniensis]TKG52041.1 DNA (cytosine-5-)-methyltransferase [Vibrio tasmaniensis]